MTCPEGAYIESHQHSEALQQIFNHDLNQSKCIQILDIGIRQNSNQWDQVYRNFATWARLKKYLAFLGLVENLAKCWTSFGKKHAIGQNFLVANGQLFKKFM